MENEIDNNEVESHIIFLVTEKLQEKLKKFKLTGIGWKYEGDLDWPRSADLTHENGEIKIRLRPGIPQIHTIHFQLNDPDVYQAIADKIYNWFISKDN